MTNLKIITERCETKIYKQVISIETVKGGLTLEFYRNGNPRTPYYITVTKIAIVEEF